MSYTFRIPGKILNFVQGKVRRTTIGDYSTLLSEGSGVYNGIKIDFTEELKKISFLIDFLQTSSFAHDSWNYNSLPIIRITNPKLKLTYTKRGIGQRFGIIWYYDNYSINSSSYPLTATGNDNRNYTINLNASDFLKHLGRLLYTGLEKKASCMIGTTDPEKDSGYYYYPNEFHCSYNYTVIDSAYLEFSLEINNLLELNSENTQIQWKNLSDSFVKNIDYTAQILNLNDIDVSGQYNINFLQIDNNKFYTPSSALNVSYNKSVNESESLISFKLSNEKIRNISNKNIYFFISFSSSSRKRIFFKQVTLSDLTGYPPNITEIVFTPNTTNIFTEVTEITYEISYTQLIPEGMNAGDFSIKKIQIFDNGELIQEKDIDNGQSSPIIGDDNFFSFSSAGDHIVNFIIINNKDIPSPKFEQQFLNVNQYTLPSFQNLKIERAILNNGEYIIDEFHGTLACLSFTPLGTLDSNSNFSFSIRELNPTKLISMRRLSNKNNSYILCINQNGVKEDINYNLNESKIFRVTIMDEWSKSTWQDVELTSLEYLLHFRKNQKSIGIGCAAVDLSGNGQSNEQVTVGWPLVCRDLIADTVNVLQPSSMNQLTVSSLEASNYYYASNDQSQELLTYIFDLIYPIGSLYLSLGNNHPAQGTWEQITEGFLVASENLDTPTLENSITKDILIDHYHSATVPILYNSSQGIIGLNSENLTDSYDYEFGSPYIGISGYTQNSGNTTALSMTTGSPFQTENVSSTIAINSDEIQSVIPQLKIHIWQRTG